MSITTMQTKCRWIATFYRPIHSHWSLPLKRYTKRDEGKLRHNVLYKLNFKIKIVVFLCTFEDVVCMYSTVDTTVRVYTCYSFLYTVYRCIIWDSVDLHMHMQHRYALLCSRLALNVNVNAQTTNKGHTNAKEPVVRCLK
jgi:hypothetical protein